MNDLVHAGRQFVALLVREGAYINDYAGFAVRQTERGVARLSCLFAEYGAKQSFLGSEIGLALRGDLTDKDIAGMDLGALFDDTVRVEVAQRVVADVLYLARDLLRSELGISRLVGIDLDMERRINIVSHKVLVKQNGVLVVVAFPRHKADEGVLTERYLAL